MSTPLVDTNPAARYQIRRAREHNQAAAHSAAMRKLQATHNRRVLALNILLAAILVMLFIIAGFIGTLTAAATY